MKDRGTIDFYNQVAKKVAGKPSKQTLSPQLLAFIDLLPNGSRVLDLGCGTGADAAHLSDAGFAVTGIDLSEGLLDVARRVAPHATFILARFEELDSVEGFDGVWANFSLLHTKKSDLPRHLAAIRRTLCPRGVFHISMVRGFGSERDEHGRFYSHFQPEELTSILTKSGFEIMATETGEKTGYGGKPSPWLAMRAIKVPTFA